MRHRQRNRKFAFGSNHFEGEPCPATCAGYNPESEVLELAELYDEILRKQTERKHGTVDEQTAKEAWLKAIETTEQKAEKTRKPHRETDLRKTVVTARDVAYDLGWL